MSPPADPPAVAIVLPPRETFAPDAAGAIAMVVRRLAGAGATVFGTPREQTFAGIPYVGITGSLALSRALVRLRPDVIEIHQQPRLAIALSVLFPRTRVLLFLHNDPLAMRGLKTRLGRRLARRRLHRVVCVSAYLANRFGPGADILPNPLTLADLPPQPERKRQEILFAGRIVDAKAPDVFVAACAAALKQLPGWRARLIGGDRFGPHSPTTPYLTHIRAAARAAGLSLQGPLPHAEVLQAMAEAAIVVVPSRWAEPFGLAALEAMASGAALICTSQGGLPEVAGPAALIVPPGDADALAAAILSLARDPAERARLAAAGLARARQFDTPVIAARLAKLRASG